MRVNSPNSSYGHVYHGIVFQSVKGCLDMESKKRKYFDDWVVQTALSFTVATLELPLYIFKMLNTLITH